MIVHKYFNELIINFLLRINLLHIKNYQSFYEKLINSLKIIKNFLLVFESLLLMIYHHFKKCLD